MVLSSAFYKREVRFSINAIIFGNDMQIQMPWVIIPARSAFSRRLSAITSGVCGNVSTSAISAAFQDYSCTKNGYCVIFEWSRLIYKSVLVLPQMGQRCFCGRGLFPLSPPIHATQRRAAQDSAVPDTRAHVWLWPRQGPPHGRPAPRRRGRHHRRRREVLLVTKACLYRRPLFLPGQSVDRRHAD